MAYGDPIDRYEVENIVNDAVRRAKRQIDEQAAERERMLQGQISDLQDEVRTLQQALDDHAQPWDARMGVAHGTANP